MTSESLKKPEKKSLIAKIRNYFLAGVVVMIPIAATVYLTIFIINISEKILPKSINPNQYLPFDIPGLEILIAFLILTFIGLLSLTFLGKRLLLGILLAFSLNLVQSLLQSMAVVSFLTPFNAVLLPFLGIFLISLYLWKSRAT